VRHRRELATRTYRRCCLFRRPRVDPRTRARHRASRRTRATCRRPSGQPRRPRGKRRLRARHFEYLSRLRDAASLLQSRSPDNGSAEFDSKSLGGTPSADPVRPRTILRLCGSSESEPPRRVGPNRLSPAHALLRRFGGHHPRSRSSPRPRERWSRSSRHFCKRLADEPSKLSDIG
jgi:hypothetical protein